MKGKDLKNSILQMAVQGKLVPQDPNDESASVLLEHIREQRRQLIAEGKLKAPKGGESVIYRASDGSHYEKRVDAKGRVLSVECIEDEIPFEIPKSWEWVRIGSLCLKIGSGSTPAGGRAVYTTTGPILIRSQNVYDDGLRLDDVAHFSYETYSKRGRHVKARDVLLNITGASIGRCAIVPDPFVEADVNQHVLILRLIDYSPQEYLHLAMTSPAVQDAIMKQQVGATKEGLSATKASNLLIPLPSLREQKLICDRVEEIVSHISQYDALESARQQLDAGLPDRLRKSILQMAVRGKLVPQDSDDEPASVLLERIREQRRQLIAEGKLKAPKGGESVIYRASDGSYYEKRVDAKGREGEPVCIDDEIPFEIPDSWEWARLGSLVLNRPQVTPDNSFCYIDIGSIDNMSLQLSSEETVIQPNNAPSRARKPVEVGDVLYSTVRPYLHNACIVDRRMSCPAIASTGFAAMVCPAGLSSAYLLACMVSPFFDSYANDLDNAKGVAYPAINDTRLYRGLISVPPQAEQARITMRIDELLKRVTNQ